MDDRIREGLRAKGYSDAQIKSGEQAMEKLVGGAIGVAATTVAVAGSSVVALFKGSTSPISSTFGWCKRNLFR